jgi:hypothetical protein
MNLNDRTRDNSDQVKLGFMKGRIVLDDGMAAYYPTGAFLPLFEVYVADVESISIQKAPKLKVNMKLLGQGTTLAECEISQDQANAVRKWFNSQRPS